MFVQFTDKPTTLKQANTYSPAEIQAFVCSWESGFMCLHALRQLCDSFRVSKVKGKADSTKLLTGQKRRKPENDEGNPPSVGGAALWWTTEFLYQLVLIAAK